MYNFAKKKFGPYIFAKKWKEKCKIIPPVCAPRKTWVQKRWINSMSPDGVM
jgi:hypothetical protein